MPDAEAQRLWHALARRSSLVDVVEEGLRSLTEGERVEAIGRVMADKPTQTLAARLGLTMGPPGAGWVLMNESKRTNVMGLLGRQAEEHTRTTSWMRPHAAGSLPEPPCRACEQLESGTCNFCGRTVGGVVTVGGGGLHDGDLDPTPIETVPTDHYMQVREDAGRCLSWIPAEETGAFWYCEGEAGHAGRHHNLPIRWDRTPADSPSPGPTGALDSGH